MRLIIGIAIAIALGIVAFNRSEREIQITIPQIEIIIHQPRQEQ